MCGIVGIISISGNPIDRLVLERFTDSLKHRGPDGQGIWLSQNRDAGLGHRRLSVLDLTDRGTQPMKSPYSDEVMVYNGEIYNFLEIRDELAARGYEFHSEGDSEVILASWHCWGEHMQTRFNGMWALAIYNPISKSLFVSRDRFGVKPLFYFRHTTAFGFASELKAFRSYDGIQLALDRESARVLLLDPFYLEGTERTLIKGIRRLPAGHQGWLRDGNLTITRWWNTIDHLEQLPDQFEVNKERFYSIFFDAVVKRLRSDVPVGSSLSGGFDSTAVTCTISDAARCRNQRVPASWQNTFTMTFPGKSNDEREIAEEVVQYCGVLGNFLTIHDTDYINLFDKVLFDFDDVYCGVPTPAWVLYRAMRQAGVLVSLDGHGADELMGAYKQADFLFFHDAPSWLFHPLENLRRIGRVWAVFNDSPIFERGCRRIGNLMSAQLRYHRSFLNIRRLFERSRNSRASDPSTLYDPASGFRNAGLNDLLPADWGALNCELYYHFHATTLPTILRNFDRMSMAHGVEVRMPFLDWRLVCFVMSLPDSYKIGQGMTKRIAREALKGRIPESARTSPIKIGFGSPLPELFGQSQFKEWAFALLRRVGDHDLVDIAKLGQTVARRATGVNWTEDARTWLSLHLLWYEQNFIG